MGDGEGTPGRRGPAVYIRFCAAVTTKFAKKNKGIVTSASTGAVLLLPVPAASVRYLLAVVGFPMSRVTQIVGPEGSCKSSLAIEVARWHRISGGGGRKIDVEDKPMPDLTASLLGYDEHALSGQVSGIAGELAAAAHVLHSELAGDVP